MKEISYSEAIAQIEAILKKFQGEELDIDTLAADVKRATELIKMCRERLAKVEKDVEKALKEE